MPLLTGDSFVGVKVSAKDSTGLVGFDGFDPEVGGGNCWPVPSIAYVYVVLGFCAALWQVNESFLCWTTRRAGALVQIVRIAADSGGTESETDPETRFGAGCRIRKMLGMPAPSEFVMRVFESRSEKKDLKKRESVLLFCWRTAQETVRDMS